MNAAISFEKRMVAQQALLTVSAFAVLAAFTPAVIRPDSAVVVELVFRVALVGVVAAMFVALVTKLRLRRLRYTLRSLALGSTGVEAHDIHALRRAPAEVLVLRVVVEAFAVGAIVVASPATLGAEIPRELATLAVMSILATCVPALVVAQTSVARVLEVAPLEVVTAALDEQAARGAAQRRSRRNLTFAVVIPIMLVGVGGALASYAQLRAIRDGGRRTTAINVARGVVSTLETRQKVGQEAAIERARTFGYEVAFSPDEDADDDHTVRTPEGAWLVTAPLDKGSVTVRYASELDLSPSYPFALVAFAFTLLGLIAALWVARLLSSDLSRATERLRTLGTDAVLHGQGEERFEARFEVVGALARAALVLAERFRVFAAAQERALEAKETALRLRGLFFASVSHDLKSPLNAILGFADTIDRKELSPSQCESLDLISTRGRELVGLIETILDAARVEAGQLKLAKRTVKVGSILATTAKLARELAQESGELKVEFAEDLPLTAIDPVHLPRALAVIIAHALRASTHDGAPARVTVRATLPARERRIQIEIDHGNTNITASELNALFSRQSSSRGRGLTLGLSLARSVFDLHQGSIEVQGSAGSTVVLAYLPAAAPPLLGNAPAAG